MPRCIVLHPVDNVATLIDPARAGEDCTLQGEAAGRVAVRQDVPFGHKICIADIAAGAPVLKYGEVIGVATQAIVRGEHAHVHNFDSARARGDLKQGARS
jgi:altronate dehydratase small subunit